MNDNECIEFVKSIYPDAIAIKGITNYSIIETPYIETFKYNFKSQVQQLYNHLEKTWEYDNVPGSISNGWHTSIQDAWVYAAKILENKIYSKLER